MMAIVGGLHILVLIDATPPIKAAIQDRQQSAETIHVSQIILAKQSDPYPTYLT